MKQWVIALERNLRTWDLAKGNIRTSIFKIWTQVSVQIVRDLIN